MMSPLAVCRACLSADVYVCPAPREYIDQFVSLTKLTIQESDGKPLGLCHICCHYIRKYHKFQERCLQADDILNRHKLLHTENSIDEDFIQMGYSLTPELKCTAVKIVDLSYLVSQEHSQLSTNLEVKQERGDTNYNHADVKFEAHEDILSAGDEEPLAKTMPVITSTHGNVQELWKDSSSDLLSSLPDKCNKDNKQNGHSGSMLPLKTLRVVLHRLDIIQRRESQGDVKKEPDHATRYHSEDSELIRYNTARDARKTALTENETLLSHRELDQNPNKFKSMAAYLALKSKSNSKQHLITHTGVKPYQCDVCNKRYEHNGSLKQHLLIHGDKSYQCDICERKFKIKTSLTKHLKTHTGEKPYQCEVCEKRYGRKDYLQQHLARHTGVPKKKPFQCEVCEKRYARRGQLQMHLTSHTGEKPYQCEVCEKRFNHPGSYKQHLFIHTELRPYQCKVCEKRFKCATSLKRHHITHTGDKPYQCKDCVKVFKHKSSLKNHLITHTKNSIQHQRKKSHLKTHTEEKPYRCDVCDASISNKSNLKRHLKIHKGEKPYQCEVCEKRFYHQGSLKQHLLRHTGEKPYQCDVCKRKFNCRSSLRIHLMRHTGEKPYQCEVCDKRFYRKYNYKMHLVTHTGQKPYQCGVCEKRFLRKGSIKKHLITSKKCHYKKGKKKVDQL